MITYTSDIPAAIHAELARREITPYRMARDLGMPPGSVYAILGGGRSPTAATCRRMLDYLGLVVAQGAPESPAVERGEKSGSED